MNDEGGDSLRLLDSGIISLSHSLLLFSLPTPHARSLRFFPFPHRARHISPAPLILNVFHIISVTFLKYIHVRRPRKRYTHAQSIYTPNTIFRMYIYLQRPVVVKLLFLSPPQNPYIYSSSLVDLSPASALVTVAAHTTLLTIAAG